MANSTQQTLSPTTITTDLPETTRETTSTTDITSTTMMKYSTQPTNPGDDSGDKIGVIIGSVIGAVAVAIVVLVVVFLIFRHRKRKRKQNKPIPVAPHKDELDRPHIDGIVAPDEHSSGTSSNPYANIDAHGRPNDETNPELDPEGYLKKHTPVKKVVNKIRGKKKRKKRNKHGYQKEQSDISLPDYGNVGFGADFNKGDVALEMSETTHEDVEIQSSGELGYVDGRIADNIQQPAHYYNTDGIVAGKSTPRTRRTKDSNSDRKANQNVEPTIPADTVGITPHGELRQSHYENIPHKQKHTEYQRQISEEVYENP